MNKLVLFRKLLMNSDLFEFKFKQKYFNQIELNEFN
jgi:hypothetical protein